MQWHVSEGNCGIIDLEKVPSMTASIDAPVRDVFGPVFGGKLNTVGGL